MIRAVIFDLDGTLVNSIEDLADSTNYALKIMGFSTHKTEEYKYFVGDGMPKLIERALPKEINEPQIREKTLHIFLERYRKHYMDKTKPYDGIIKLIDTLTENGYKLAVVSNKVQEMADTVVGNLIGNRFEMICGKRKNYPAKPDPLLTLEVISRLEVKPSECLFVGDSGIDMLTAKNAGCRAVGALWGFRTKEELIENGAEFTADSPLRILSVLKETDNEK